jgi:hypothetical protein
MLNPERISIGRVKQAYRLNAHEADALITVLASRNCIDLYELWHEATHFVATKENNKKSLYDEISEPYFPNTSDLIQDLLQGRIATKRLLRHFLYSARSKTPKDHLQKIFDRVMCFTYDEPSDQHINSINRMLDMIYEQCIFGFHGKDKVDIAWEHVSPELFAKFCGFFDDAASANKVVAVLHLFEHGYSLVHEVKGLSKEIVRRILATAAATQDQTTHAPPLSKSPSTAILVTRALWEGKSPEAVRDGMRENGFGDPIIAYAVFEWCKVSKTRIGRLLGPRGENEHDSTSRNRANELLAEAAAFTIITD